MIQFGSLFNLSGTDGIIIFGVVFLLFGAKKLPELARGMGQAVREFTRAREDFARELERPTQPYQDGNHDPAHAHTLPEVRSAEGKVPHGTHNESAEVVRVVETSGGNEVAIAHPTEGTASTSPDAASLEAARGTGGTVSPK
jgi:sec-independent protein translocase protein TatA